jgi:hypothetical protein
VDRTEQSVLSMGEATFTGVVEASGKVMTPGSEATNGLHDFTFFSGSN